MTQITTSNTSLLKFPVIIPRDVFQALSPLDQLAAQALERVGKIRISPDTDIPKNQ